MSKLKKDLPVYVLSASLVFLGISINSNQANAASASASAADLARVQNDLNLFKQCAIQNFRTISYFDASRDTRINSIRPCF